MRQASEKSAVAIGLENLARTAGYPDPVRLEWAMEAQSVADLAAGPVAAQAGDVTVTLSINAWGDAGDGAVDKQSDKALKATPARRQKRSGGGGLDGAQDRDRAAGVPHAAIAGRGDVPGRRVYRGRAGQLLEHPVLAPMLRSLVLIGADGLAGYPVHGGRALEEL